MLIYFWLERTLFKLSLNLLEFLQVFFVCYYTMKQVELLVSVLRPVHVIFVLGGVLDIKFVSYDFPISFGNSFDNPEERKIFPLFLGEELAIQFYEFEEDGLQEDLGVVHSLVNVHEGHDAVKNKPCGYNFITEVYQLHQPPAVGDGRFLLILSRVEKQLV